MSVIIKSGSSTSLASVDTNNNLQVNPPTDPDLSGFVTVTAEADPGDVTGTRLLRNIEVTDDYRLRTGTDQTFFNEYFPGTTINGNIWNTLLLTMTAPVASNFVTLNSGLSTASGAFAQVRSWRHMPVFMTFPTYAEIDLHFTQAPVTGNVMEWGLGIAATTTAPTDGAFFRINASGEFRAVLSTGGVEIQSDDITLQLPDVNVTSDYLVVLSEKVVEYWINDVLVAKIPRSTSSGSTTSSMNLPLFIRTYNSSVTAAAQTIKVGYVNVSLGDMNTGKPWPHVINGAGGMAYQAQSGAAALGSTALITNSSGVAGVGAVMTNGTAALGSGLGGQFVAQPSFAAGNDGIISSYQVPIGTASLPGKSLYITGVKIHGAVTTVLAGGPVLYAYSLAYGHTNVSLATVESNGVAKAPRRIALGFETFAATAAVGTIGSPGGCYMQFNSPVIVQPGEFVQTVAKNLGVVTSSGVITFFVSFDGYFE
jgi:hypothetical protein